MFADINTKVCSKCKIEKEFSSFVKCKEGRFGLSSHCKFCQKQRRSANKDYLLEQKKKYYQENKEKIQKNKKLYEQKNVKKVKEWQKIYYLKNKDNILLKSKKYKEQNKESLQEKNKEYALKNKDRKSAYDKEYSCKNKKKIADRRSSYYQENKNRIYKNYKKRKDIDVLFRLKERVRLGVANSIYRMGFTKRSRSYEILGCDWETFKNHIERQFHNGMSWDNFNKIHIDHIIPIATAKTEEDVIRLNHFTNLRPLFAKDNIIKGDKVLNLL